MATVKVLVIGGGGQGGGSDPGSARGGGGGGAGGYQYNASFTVTPGTPISVTVGAGGSTGTAATDGQDGSNSVFSSITANGGGGGGHGGAVQGHNGGCGGGNGRNNTGAGGTGSQGGNGGSGGAGFSGGDGGGGGGGASANGANGTAGPTGVGGNGGAGTANSISGASVTYAGGGGGGNNGSGTAGSGGAGGGGAGGKDAAGSAGTANRGGGGGGAGGNGLTVAGGAGGSGIVIVAFPIDGSNGLGVASTGGTITQVGAEQIHTFTTSGTFTPIAVVAPTVTTETPAKAITSNSAEGGGNVTNNGGGTVSERGIAWGTSSNPTIAGSHQSSGSGTGAFTGVPMTGLLPDTHYFYRAYATNEAGTAYGANVEFDTLDAVISGTCTLAGNPVENAIITLINSDTDAVVDTQLTDASGNYAFVGLDVTVTYHVTAEFIDGYDMYNAKSLPFMTPEEV